MNEEQIPRSMEDVPESREEYPLFAYIYNEDGTYYEPIEIRSKGSLHTLFVLAVLPAMIDGREVRITDTDDCMVFWAQHGEIKFPPPPSSEEGKGQ